MKKLLEKRNLEKQAETVATIREAGAVLPFQTTVAHALSRIKGGLPVAMEVARLAASKSEEIAKVVYQWDQLNRNEKARCKIEYLCNGAGIDPADFLGEIASMAFRVNMDTSKFMAAMAQPEVLERTIQTALDVDAKDSLKAQELLHKASGFLPTSKGIQIGIQQNNNAADDTGLPSFESDVIEITEATR